nr:SGNH/GDSL hydrolase family protein [Lacticaseibacillus kribbianus]
MFTGDSVTDCGRDRAAMPGTTESLGDGYPNLISAALTALYPELTVMVQNTGVSGDTTNQLLARFDADVVQQHPDVAAILIGVNDVWRFFDAPFYHPTDLVDAAQYRANYQAMIDAARGTIPELLILSPFMFEPNHADPMRHQVDAYRAIAQALAEANGATYLDLQAPIDRYLANRASYILSADRVHPNLKGHMLIATQILNALGFDWRHQQPEADHA